MSTLNQTMTKTTLRHKPQAEKKRSKGALKLMETAERLFGEHGVDGVSLRQIVTAAGYANSYAIQHHFGTKEGLLQAVYDMRLPKLDAGRKKRLEKEKEISAGADIDGLLRAFFFPLIEDFDESIQKTYQQFNTRLLQSEALAHPYFSSSVPQSAALEIVERLRQILPSLPQLVFEARLRLVSELFLSAMAERRRLEYSGQDPYPSKQVYWNEVLLAMRSLFCIPFPNIDS